MVSVYDVDGKMLPATVIKCEPNVVLEANGKNIKVGYEQVAEKKLNKPELGYFKKLGVKPHKLIVEFNDVDKQYNKNDEIKVDSFENGQWVDIQGLTRGRGYTGAIVRWNYKIGPKSHGAGFPHRYQGSIAFGRGGSQGQRVPKGKKMAGQYGHETVTTENLTILEIYPKWNVMLVLGAVVGPVDGTVFIKSSVKQPGKKTEFKIINKEIQEAIIEQNEKLENKEALHEANVQSEQAAEKQAAAEQAESAPATPADANK